MVKSVKRSTIALLLFITLVSMQSVTTLAADKILKKSMFNHLVNVNTPQKLQDDKDTPEGFCIVGNTAYVTKIHNDGTTTLVKIPDLSKPKQKVWPAKNLELGHANDLTYYNGYLYVAGLDKKIYRVKDNGKNASGEEKYAKKAYTVNGIGSSENTWNIAHFSGKYFIVCSSINNSSLQMKYRVGYFDDKNSQFVTKKVFYAKAKEFNTLQGLAYADGYLYQATSDNKGTKYKNKISIYDIGFTYGDITNNKTYALDSYGTFDDSNYSGKPDKKKFEIESLDITEDGYIYIIMNVDGHADPIFVSKKGYSQVNAEFVRFQE